ncbi:MAG: carbamoyltransferase HypF, partial [Planctomycetes bacterium]|nr:carbamoyltransferase HypF [Planctomycetota bacterium]
KCGPGIWLTGPKGRILTNDKEETVTATAQMLRDGKIVAIKGIGGFHLAVDALNEEAVKTLRQRKKRDHKPFALMARSLKGIKQYAEVSEQAGQLLKSPQAPIVLLPKKDSCVIAPSVAQGFSTLGFMLCYAPLHYMILEQDIDVLVMTSANISDEPLICDNDLALEKLGNIADGFLMHDRDIYRQIDDSVFHIIENKPVPLRRARGYVPTPIRSKSTLSADVLATGSDMKNTFCFAKHDQLICSEHIGDLADGLTYHHYIKSIDHLAGLFEVKPKVIACDLHPGYLSTQYAQSRKPEKILHIQHHWAHAASVLAENNIDGPVIALVCDGTGYGSDGAIWGCECLIASLEKFDRFAHLAYFPLPGADMASKEAIRPLLGLLTKVYGDGFNINILEKIEPDTQKIEIILQQIEKKLNTIETSSLGRVFDAVAALAGIGNRNSFDAELPMKLQECIMPGIEQSYGFRIIQDDNMLFKLDISRMIREIIADVNTNISAGVISARFHNCLCDALTAIALKAREKTKLNTVALSGGVFCNRYLAEKTINFLKKNDFNVLFNTTVASNDGGVSLGQAAIAAAVVSK